MDIQTVVRRGEELLEQWSVDDRPRSFTLDPDSLGIRHVDVGEPGSDSVSTDLSDWTDDEITDRMMDSVRIIVWPRSEIPVKGLDPNSFEMAMHFNYRAVAYIDRHTVAVLVRPEGGWPVQPAGDGLPVVIWRLKYLAFMSSIVPKAAELAGEEVGVEVKEEEDMEEWEKEQQMEVHSLMSKKVAELIGAQYYAGPCNQVPA